MAHHYCPLHFINTLYFSTLTLSSRRRWERNIPRWISTSQRIPWVFITFLLSICHVRDCWRYAPRRYCTMVLQYHLLSLGDHRPQRITSIGVHRLLRTSRTRLRASSPKYPAAVVATNSQQVFNKRVSSLGRERRHARTLYNPSSLVPSSGSLSLSLSLSLFGSLTPSSIGKVDSREKNR